MVKIKVTRKEKLNDSHIIYHFESHYAIRSLTFLKTDSYNWVVNILNINLDRVLILFIESVLRGLNGRD